MEALLYSALDPRNSRFYGSLPALLSTDFSTATINSARSSFWDSQLDERRGSTDTFGSIVGIEDIVFPCNSASMSSFATEPVVSSVPETWGVQDNDYPISVRPLLASTDSAYGLELANDSSEHSDADSETDESESDMEESASEQANPAAQSHWGAPSTQSRMRRPPVTYDSSETVDHTRKRKSASDARAVASGKAKKAKTSGKKTKSDSKANMDKKALKKLKNREAAARCRNRRKQLIDDLTDLTEKLEAEKAKISNENKRLKARVSELEGRVRSAGKACNMCAGPLAFEGVVSSSNETFAAQPAMYGSGKMSNRDVNKALSMLLGADDEEMGIYGAPEELASMLHM